MGNSCLGSAGNTSATGSVKIYGMPISGNVIPPVLLALDKKCGAMELMDMMQGENKTPEKLKINPWGQMPSMSDGDYCLAESNAILRYLAYSYAPECYGESNAKKKAEIDWALDWCAINFNKNYADIWYPVAGFGKPPADQAEANKKALDNIDMFLKKFLASSKFVGGETLSIADYKIGTLFWYLNHPAIKKHTGFELTARAKQYVEDFVKATPSRDFLDAGKKFMDSKN